MRDVLLAVVLLGASGCGQKTEPPPPGYTIEATAGTRSALYAGDRALAADVLALSKAGGGTIRFSAGTFEFATGLDVNQIRNVRFVGAKEGTVFRLRKLDDWGLIRTVGTQPLDTKSLAVDRPELLRPGAPYQLFLPGRYPNRYVEMRVAAIADGKATLSSTVCTNPQAKEISDGSYVVPQLSVLDGFLISGVSFTDIVFDGNVEDVKKVALGGVNFAGHTTHCGLLFRNSYRDQAKRPAARDITIERCVFRGFLGRGFVVYNTDGVVIRDCRFERVRTEALEIDHWCRDVRIESSSFAGAHVGLQLNDCNSTVVENCAFESCAIGVKIVDALKDRTTNRGLTIRKSRFAKLGTGIEVPPFAEDNAIVDNVFESAGAVAIVVRGDKNTIAGNTVTGSAKAGVLLEGKECVVRDNAIAAPNGAADFKPIR